MRSESVHSGRIYDRWCIFATLGWVYVTLASFEGVRFGPKAAALLCGGPLLLLVIWRFTRRSLRSDAAGVDPAALAGLRLCAWGAGIWLLSRLGSVERSGLDLAASLGLGSAALGSIWALARIPGQPGLFQPPRSAQRLDLVAVCATSWVFVGLLSILHVLWPEASGLRASTLTRWREVAALCSMLVEVAAGLRLVRGRRHELGVTERASGACVLSITALGISGVAALSSLDNAERSLSLGMLASALACASAATVSEPSRISNMLRIGVVLSALGIPLGLGMSAWLVRAPQSAMFIGCAACALGAFVGLLARALALSLAPDQARRVHKLAAAARAALEPEPESALLATLQSLHGLERDIHQHAELWRRDPPEVLYVDVAGYLHREDSAAPDQIYALAGMEPERTLRRDALSALEVQKPEVRPALAWLEARNARAVTRLEGEQGPIGLLLLPRASRRSAVTLAEARAVRRLADRLSAVVALSSSLARARLAEARAVARVKELEQECERLDSALSIRTGPRDSVLEVLASRVRIAAYGSRARSAASDLERFARAALDVGCEIPVGIEPLSWAAAFHLAGPRPGGPLTITQGTALEAHVPEYWSDGTDGALRRAEGGTLVILNLAALPVSAQEALAQALWRRSAPAVGARVPPVLFATLAASPRELVEARRLSLTLAQYLMPQHLRVPPLRERKEDLRGLILDRLLRSGVCAETEALGIEPEAMALLLEYDWPGNESELHGVIDRAARTASAERILVADLEQAGFAGIGRASPVGAAAERIDDAPASERERRSHSSGPPAPAISGVRRATRGADTRPEETAAAALTGTEASSPEAEPDLARAKRASPRRRRRR